MDLGSYFSWIFGSNIEYSSLFICKINGFVLRPLVYVDIETVLISNKEL